MTPREAGKLLGGYATGTLTEAERGALFAAVLEDQELFDALADEEALRELLADPDVRARLLAGLARSSGGALIPFWRRPAAMGLAASILAAVGVGLLLRHGHSPAMPQGRAPVLSEESPKAPVPAQPPAESKPGSETRQTRPFAKPARRSDRPAIAPPPPAPASSLAADAAAGVPGSADLSAPSTADHLAAPSPAREKAEAKSAPTPPMAQAAAGVAGNFYAQGLVPDATKNRSALPAPTWSLEPAPAGSFRLRVRWGPEGHLYLLSRGPLGTSSLAATSTSSQGGKRESLFSGDIGTGSVLDLYLLPVESSAPEALPAEGSLQGFRERVWPPEKKAP